MSARPSTAARTLDFALDALAAYRITKLVTHDTITAQPRAALIEGAYRRQARREHKTLSERIGQPVRSMRPSDWDDLAIGESECAPKLATLITCRWCAGFYVAVGVAAARRFMPGWRHGARALALSACAALVAGLES